MTRLAATTLFLAIAVSACGDPDEQKVIPGSVAPAQFDTPVSPPQPPPTPTATPAPVLLSTGWLVHRRSGDVYASALDGTGEMRLDAGDVAPDAAEYVGFARIDGEAWVYLLSPTVAFPSNRAETLYEAVIVRTSLASGRSERIFDFPGRILLAEFRPNHASVSPNGARVAYSANDGVRIFDTLDGADALLVSNGACAGDKCAFFGTPLWSPAGDAILITKQLYEGTHLVHVRLGDQDTVTEFDGVGAAAKVWAPDGRRFCTYGEIFVPGGTWVFEADTLERRDWDETLLAPGGVIGSGCALEGEYVAVSFVNNEGTDAKRTIAWIELVGHGAAIAYPEAPNLCSAIDAFLPGASGLVISNARQCDGLQPNPQVLLIDGSVRAFPFAAGEVLTVIPAAP